ncbi:hypothetical protein GE09DRAFT_253884 [Coniochaeta sp. 2T2.1]|nr:hypothetical protein GE09DRAFT_253884 [Coniochaeta sp. 2T2.1]
MSRNARQKPTPSRAPKPKRRRISDTTATSSSSLNLSDDGGYSAVEEISESEDDDEEHVFAAEEEHIISHAAHRGHNQRSLPPQQDVEDDADEEDDDDDEDDAELPKQVAEEAEEDDEEDSDGGASWGGILTDDEDPTQDPAVRDFGIIYGELPDLSAANVERHVRFTGVPDSDSDSTTTDTTEDVEGFFPDIFVEQGSLDPAFRREIEYDPEDSSNSGTSFWDFGSQDKFDFDSDEEVHAQGPDDDTPTPTPTVSQAPTEASTPVATPVVQELDGYETDGDTTEEDIPEPPVRRKMVRRIEFVDASSDSDTERPRRSHKRGQPRLGRYNLDSSDRKPVAVLNPISRKMMIFTPQRMRRLDLSPESFNLDFFTNAPLPEESPILSNSASMMLGAMFSSNPFGDFVNGPAMAPTEAFFSLASEGMTADESDETGEIEDAEDEEERNLKLEDFITFNPEDSDEEGHDENWDGDTNTAASTPGRPSTSASRMSGISDGSMADVHPLLSHFDNNSNAVGAFRRNQINQQLILSDRASHESLAFSGPYHYGTLRGIKTGSLETVTAPITPLRRHKKSATNGYADLNRSPSESVSQKRKASSALGDPFHKRHRSISDMGALQL